jgi:hypothetical protein
MGSLSFGSGFLTRKAQRHLAEHVQHEQSEKVLGVDFVLVPKPELAGLVHQVLAVVKTVRKTQWMVFE